MKVDLTCGYCAKDFQMENWAYRKAMKRNTKSFYCTRPCYDAHQRNNLRLGKDVECTYCKKFFYLKLNRIVKGSSFFCGVECQNKHREESRVVKNCLCCDGEFIVPPHLVAGRAAHYYCGSQCRNKARKLFLGNFTREHFDYMQKRALQTAGFNKLEQKGYKILNELKVNYIKQHRIGFYTADVYVPDLKLVIEFDGDYWHGHPKLVEKNGGNLTVHQKHGISRDKRKNTYLLNHGYTILRLWERDINKNPEEVKQQIRNIIKKSSTQNCLPLVW